MFFYRKN